MEKRTILHIYTDSPSFQPIAKIIIKTTKSPKLGNCFNYFQEKQIC